MYNNHRKGEKHNWGNRMPLPPFPQSIVVSICRPSVVLHQENTNTLLDLIQSIKSAITQLLLRTYDRYMISEKML